MALLVGQESAGPLAVRGVASGVGAFAGAFTTLAICLSVALLREAPGRHFAARGNPLSAWASVLRSPHARLFVTSQGAEPAVATHPQVSTLASLTVGRAFESSRV